MGTHVEGYGFQAAPPVDVKMVSEAMWSFSRGGLGGAPMGKACFDSTDAAIVSTVIKRFGCV